FLLPVRELRPREIGLKDRRPHDADHGFVVNSSFVLVSPLAHGGPEIRGGLPIALRSSLEVRPYLGRELFLFFLRQGSRLFCFGQEETAQEVVEPGEACRTGGGLR